MQIIIKDKKFCRRFCYQIIRNIKVAPSSNLIQKRLNQCGIRAINNIVDATNYIMLEIGQPMHAYDLDKLGNKLVVEKGKFFGIKGPENIGISENTRNILLESANFNPADIRETSKKLGLKTEASARFERGVDINLCKIALEKCSKLINGDKEKIQDTRYKIQDTKIKFKINKILKSLGFKSRGKYIVAPSWRYDINIPEDLEEEVLRIYGYENIKPKMPISTLIPAKQNELVVWANRAKDILVSLGFSEVYNYSLVKEKTDSKIKNQNKYLRSSLIPQIKENLKLNSKNFKKVRIFELGKIYPEKWHLCGAALDNAEAKGVVDILFEKMGLVETIEEIVKLDNNIFDFDFEKLAKLATEEREYEPIPKYPPVKRDLAVWVEPETKIDYVLSVIQEAEPVLIYDVDLFDIYEDKDKKSLAFHIIYQAEDRTLTDDEVNQIHEKVMNNLEKQIKNLKVRR
ncbi:MAG: phenylalanine--tRNA ligase subunit beta [bacterium]